MQATGPRRNVGGDCGPRYPVSMNMSGFLESGCAASLVDMLAVLIPYTSRELAMGSTPVSYERIASYEPYLALRVHECYQVATRNSLVYLFMAHSSNKQARGMLDLRVRVFPLLGPLCLIEPSKRIRNNIAVSVSAIPHTCIAFSTK